MKNKLFGITFTAAVILTISLIISCVPEKEIITKEVDKEVPGDEIQIPLDGTIIENKSELIAKLSDSNVKNLYVVRPVELGSGDTITVHHYQTVYFISMYAAGKAVPTTTGTLTLKPGAVVNIESGGWLDFRSGTTFEIEDLAGVTLNTTYNVISIAIENAAVIQKQSTISVLARQSPPVTLSIHGISYIPGVSDTTTDLYRVGVLRSISDAFKDAELSAVNPITSWSMASANYKKTIYTEDGAVVKLPKNNAAQYKIEYTAPDEDGVTFSKNDNTLSFALNTVTDYTLSFVISYLNDSSRVEGTIDFEAKARAKDVKLSLPNPRPENSTISNDYSIINDTNSPFNGKKHIIIKLSTVTTGNQIGLYKIIAEDSEALLSENRTRAYFPLKIEKEYTQHVSVQYLAPLPSPFNDTFKSYSNGLYTFTANNVVGENSLTDENGNFLQGIAKIYLPGRVPSEDPLSSTGIFTEGGAVWFSISVGEANKETLVYIVEVQVQSPGYSANISSKSVMKDGSTRPHYNIDSTVKTIATSYTALTSYTLVETLLTNIEKGNPAQTLKVLTAANASAVTSLATAQGAVGKTPDKNIEAGDILLVIAGPRPGNEASLITTEPYYEKYTITRIVPKLFVKYITHLGVGNLPSPTAVIPGAGGRFEIGFTGQGEAGPSQYLLDNENAHVAVTDLAPAGISVFVEQARSVIRIINGSPDITNRSIVLSVPPNTGFQDRTIKFNLKIEGSAQTWADPVNEDGALFNFTQSAGQEAFDVSEFGTSVFTIIPAATPQANILFGQVKLSGNTITYNNGTVKTFTLNLLLPKDTAIQALITKLGDGGKFKFNLSDDPSVLPILVVSVAESTSLYDGTTKTLELSESFYNAVKVLFVTTAIPNAPLVISGDPAGYGTVVVKSKLNISGGNYEIRSASVSGDIIAGDTAFSGGTLKIDAPNLTNAAVFGAALALSGSVSLELAAPIAIGVRANLTIGAGSTLTFGGHALSTGSTINISGTLNDNVGTISAALFRIFPADIMPLTSTITFDAGSKFINTSGMAVSTDDITIIGASNSLGGDTYFKTSANSIVRLSTVGAAASKAQTRQISIITGDVTITPQPSYDDWVIKNTAALFVGGGPEQMDAGALTNTTGNGLRLSNNTLTGTDAKYGTLTVENGGTFNGLLTLYDDGGGTQKYGVAAGITNAVKLNAGSQFNGLTVASAAFDTVTLTSNVSPVTATNIIRVEGTSTTSEGTWYLSKSSQTNPNTASASIQKTFDYIVFGRLQKAGTTVGGITVAPATAKAALISIKTNLNAATASVLYVEKSDSYQTMGATSATHGEVLNSVQGWKTVFPPTPPTIAASIDVPIIAGTTNSILVSEYLNVVAGGTALANGYISYEAPAGTTHGSITIDTAAGYTGALNPPSPSGAFGNTYNINWGGLFILE